jgi:hypothetical protein
LSAALQAMWDAIMRCDPGRLRPSEPLRIDA